MATRSSACTTLTRNRKTLSSCSICLGLNGPPAVLYREAARSQVCLERAFDQPNAADLRVSRWTRNPSAVRGPDLPNHIERLHLPEDVKRDERGDELVFAGVEQQEPIDRHLLRSMAATPAHHGVEADMIADRGGGLTAHSDRSGWDGWNTVADASVSPGQVLTLPNLG